MEQKDGKRPAEYGVLILKRDQQHIDALVTSNYEDAYKLWNTLSNQWEKCVKEQVPFRLEKPLVTCFDPGLIFEITIRPVVENRMQESNNPYTKEMRDKGFSETFGRYTGNANAIPEGGGYKF